MQSAFFWRLWVKKCVDAIILPRRKQSTTKRLPALRWGTEELEDRCVPASLLPGKYSDATTGPITSAIEFDQAGTYEISGNLTVNGNGILTVGNVAGVTLLIDDNVTLSVAGALNLNGTASNRVSVVAQGTSNGTAQGITVTAGGSLTAPNTTFSVGAGTQSYDPSVLQVNSGGRLTAAGSTFGWTVTAFDNGSTLNPGDVTNNTFTGTVYAPPADIPLLAGNTKFADIDLNSGSTLGATPISLPVLGSASTAQRYVFSGLSGYGGTFTPFAVAANATLNFAAGTSVVINDNVKVNVAGALNLNGTASNRVSVVAQGTSNGTAQGITVTAGGSLTAPNTTFSVGAGTQSYDPSVLQVNSGGRLTAAGSTFGWTVTAFDNGSTLNPGDITGSGFDTTVYAPASFVPLLAGNLRFRDIDLNSGSSTGAPLNLPVVGTASTASQRYVFSGLTGYGGAFANFTIAGGATVNFGAGTSVLISDNVKVVVQSGGALNLNGTASNPVSVVAQGTSNGTSQGITVNGSLSATYAGFSVGAGTQSYDPSVLQVASGGRLTAAGSTFGWTVTAFDNGSTLNPGDITGSGFDTTVYAPASFVPLLAGNLRFQDIDLNSGSSTGAPLNLPVVGTASTASQRYVFSGLTGYGGAFANFTIAGGATVNFGAGTSVLISDNVKVVVQSGGALNLNGTASNPVSVVAQGTSNGTAQGITVNGSLSATYAGFSVGAGTQSYDPSVLQVNSGGRLTAAGSTFGWTVTAFDNGSTLNPGDITGSGFDTTVYAPASFVPLLAGNLRFQDIDLNSGSSTGAPLNLPVVGTASTASQRYVFSGLTGYGGAFANFTIAGGATVNFGAGTSVLISDNVKVVVQSGGALNLNGTASNPVSVVAQGTSNGTSQGITVNGSLSATYAGFSVGAGTQSYDPSVLQVASGGRLTAAGSTFGWTVTAFDNGSTLNPGDITGSGFDTTVYAPASFVPLLAGNLRFQDIDLNSGSSTGAPLNLPVVGTASTASQRYVFSGLTGYGGAFANFTIAGGATVNFGAGTSVLISDNVKVVVQSGGALNLNGTASNPVSVVAQGTSNGTAQGITVNGSLSATYAGFSVGAGTQSYDPSVLQVASGGTLAVFGGNYGFTTLQVDSGATATIKYVLVDSNLKLDSEAALTVTSDDFSSSNGHVTATGTSGATINARGNYWGTTIPGEIAQKVTDHATNSALPTVDYGLPLSNRPIQPLGSVVPAVAYSAGSQNLNLSATFTTTLGQVNSGTATFSIVQGATVFGTPVTVNVSNGAARVVYVLPAGLNLGTYTLQVVYTNGTETFSDNSQSLVITPGATTTTAAAASAFGSAAQTVTLSATVTSGGSGVGEGTVTFAVFNGATQVGSSVTSATVSNGTASAAYAVAAATPTGTYTIRAVYNPGADYTGSSDSTHSLTVNVLSLSNAAAPEFRPVGTAIGTVTVADPGHTLTYTLVAGTGADDNASFTLTAGGQLKTTGILDASVRSAYTVRVRAADETGAYTETAFAITVPHDPALSRTGTTLTVTGTAGNDTFAFTADSTDVFSLNGVTYNADPAAVKTVLFVGNGGADTAYLNAVGSRSFGATPTSATLTAGATTVQANNVKTVFAYGGAGDAAYLLDAGGSNTLLGRPDYTTLNLLGTGATITAAGFGSVTATAGTGANDAAYLYDFGGTNTFIGRPDYSYLTGAGYLNLAVGFKSVRADAAAGSNDAAYLADFGGTNSFYGTPTYSYLTGAGYLNLAVGFKSVRADAAAGSNDAAYLADFGGTNSFYGTPTYSYLTGAGYLNLAVGFKSVRADAAAGSNDAAYLSDSGGTNTFIGRPDYSYLTGAGYLNLAVGFKSVRADAAAGANDTAYLSATSGDNTFTAFATYSYLSGSGYTTTAVGFRTVYATVSGGGHNVAALSDTPGDDTFYGSGTTGTLATGTVIDYSADGFDMVNIVSGAGGTDRVSLSGIRYSLTRYGLWR